MEEEKKDAPEETAADTSAETPEVASESGKQKSKRAKPLNKKFIIVLILLVAFGLLYANYKKEAGSNTGTPESFSTYMKIKLGLEKPATLSVKEAEDFINTNLMQGGTGATVTAVTEENGLWKIMLTVSGQEYTAYLTKDKQLFFPQAINLAELQKQKADEEAQSKADDAKQLTEMTKNDKPTVELFVMSHCPYGTQIEKGIIPVVKALGDKIDFQLKFCDYSMHNDADTGDTKELTEEMNQYCIGKEQSDKLLPYLECFLADETSHDKCVAQVGIDKNKLSACVTATDSQYKITANFKDKSTWKSGSYPTFPIFQSDVDKYQVSGSPTLVINGKTVTISGRDSANLLKFICAGFTNAPAECQQTLSSTAPSAGFGYDTSSGSTTSGSCN